MNCQAAQCQCWIKYLIFLLANTLYRRNWAYDVYIVHYNTVYNPYRQIKLRDSMMLLWRNCIVRPCMLMQNPTLFIPLPFSRSVNHFGRVQQIFAQRLGNSLFPNFSLHYYPKHYEEFRGYMGSHTDWVYFLSMYHILHATYENFRSYVSKVQK